VVTAAVLKLFPRPRGQTVAIAGLSDPASALRLLRLARDVAGTGLTAFELMPRFLIELLRDHLDGARDPLGEAHPWYVLLEISSGRGDDDARGILEQALATGLERGVVRDAAIAASLEQAKVFWRMRHGVSEVQKHAGGSIKHDVSVAVERVPDFIERGSAAVAKLVPGIVPLPFGHLGDGNIHFNFTQPPGMDRTAFMARAPEVHAIMTEIVMDLGGSIAAEHGIGRYKRELLRSVKSELELDMMRRIKRAFDPNNILNPGRVV
jgi:FAD/FMN-containing dehydrogenase